MSTEKLFNGRVIKYHKGPAAKNTPFSAMLFWKYTTEVCRHQVCRQDESGRADGAFL